MLPHHRIDVVDNHNGPAHLPSHIYLDGKPLLLTEDGIEVSDPDHTRPTIATLRVIVTEVHYTHTTPDHDTTLSDLEQQLKAAVS